MKKRISSFIICLAMVVSLFVIAPTTMATVSLSSSDVSFTNGTNAITTLTANGAVVASATISNSGADKYASLYIVEYQNGDVKQVGFDKQLVTSTTPVTLTKSLTMGASVANSTIKVFVWDENITPLMNKTMLPGANKNLTNISVGGVALSDFSNSVLNYSLSSNGGNSYEVTATPEDGSAVTVSVTQVTMLPGSATVVVTPLNGESKKTFTINFTAVPAVTNVTNVSGVSGTVSAIPFNADTKIWTDRYFNINKTDIASVGGAVVQYSTLKQAGINFIADGGTLISQLFDPSGFTNATIKPFYTFEINQTAEVKIATYGPMDTSWVTDGWMDQSIAGGLFTMYNPTATPIAYYTNLYDHIYSKTFIVQPGKTRVITLNSRGVSWGFNGYIPVVRFLDNSTVNPNVNSSFLKDIKIDNTSLAAFDPYTNEYTITIPAGTNPSIVGVPLQSNSRILYADGPGCKYINVTDGNLTGTVGQAAVAPTGYQFTSTYKINIKYTTQMASEIKVVASDDTDVRKASLTTNYDGQNTNAIYPNAAQSIFSLFKFDLTTTTPDSEIQKAELCYYTPTVQYGTQQYYFGQPSNTINVFPIDPNSWTASNVTFGNMSLTYGTNSITQTDTSYISTPANAVGIGGNMPFGAIGNNKWYSVDITNYIKSNTGKLLSFALNAPIKASNNSTSYIATNAGATVNANRAYIRIVTAKYSGVDATLSDIKVNGASISGFAKEDTAYQYEVANASDNITVTATPTDSHSTVVVKQAKYLPGTAIVTVTSSGGTVTQTYTVSFMQSTLPLIDNLITLPAATVAPNATGGIALGTSINGTTPYLWSDRFWKINNTGFGVIDTASGVKNTRDNSADLAAKTTITSDGNAFISEGGTFVKFKVSSGTDFTQAPINPWYSFDINQTADVVILNPGSAALEAVYPSSDGWVKSTYANGLFQMYQENYPAAGYNGYHSIWFGKIIYTKTFVVTPGQKATVTLKNQGYGGDYYVVVVKFKATVTQ